MLVGRSELKTLQIVFDHGEKFVEFKIEKKEIIIALEQINSTFDE